MLFPDLTVFILIIVQSDFTLKESFFKRNSDEPKNERVFNTLAHRGRWMANSQTSSPEGDSVLQSLFQG